MKFLISEYPKTLEDPAPQFLFGKDIENCFPAGAHWIAAGTSLDGLNSSESAAINFRFANRRFATSLLRT